MLLPFLGIPLCMSREDETKTSLVMRVLRDLDLRPIGNLRQTESRN
jgi:hypothetical protein